MGSNWEFYVAETVTSCGWFEYVQIGAQESPGKKKHKQTNKQKSSSQKDLHEENENYDKPGSYMQSNPKTRISWRWL